MTVLIEPWRWKPNGAWNAGRNAGKRRCIGDSESFRYSPDETAGNTSRLQSIDPMLRVQLSHPFRERRDYSIAVSHAAGIRLEYSVIGETIQAKGASACAPLSITSNGDDERPVGGIE